MKVKAEKSGKFVLRLDSALHETVAQRALEAGFSLNQMTVNLIRLGLEEKSGKKYLKHFPPILAKLKKKFGSQLAGLIFFGSQVRFDSTDSSDLDLLIVLDEGILLKRNLYRWWEENFATLFKPELSPHFVHIPKNTQSASGIWFEVAMEGEILYQKNVRLRRFLNQIISEVQSGALQREWSHGHPYWIRRENEK